ncbi:acetyltransferase [Pedobacter sandarakinus]|uniref:acetyltransferase n=1 Tax=Pedobacter sandarakinus TaxID=353156 RepID=UPI002245A92E|nr:acetyltransferase [Pedobacter sandarakinus]MCX2575117.1 acetyltransferase [Pedobacter sandarakinus]
MIDVYFLGAGNHASEMGEYFTEQRDVNWAGCIVDADHHQNHPTISKSIFLIDDFIRSIPAERNTKLIGAIGDYKRSVMITRLEELGYAFINYYHPSSYISPSVKAGRGSCVAPLCVINANVVIGNHCIINSKSNISHDCVLSDFVTISPGVSIAGNVRIGEGVFIGTGANIIPDVTIGDGTYIAAGACVTKSVPANVMLAGVPASIKKSIKQALQY